MAERLSSYEAKSDTGGIESLSEKLTQDLRTHITALSLHPCLSSEWIDQSARIARIGNIAEMEQKLPKEKKEATVWESEELALRFLLEEGKLTLCLRMVDDYLTKRVEFHKKKTKPTEAEMEAMARFERGMGLVLKNAWTHSEALQSSDMNLLLANIGTTLHLNVLQGPFVELNDSLGKYSLYFLHAVVNNLERISEEVVIRNVASHKVFEHCVSHLVKQKDALKNEDLLVGCQALSGLASSEEFQVKQASIVTKKAKEGLLELDRSVLKTWAEDFTTRKTLRSLLDLIEALKRE